MFDENSDVSGVCVWPLSVNLKGKALGTRLLFRCEAVLACGLDSGSSCLVRALTGVIVLCS